MSFITLFFLALSVSADAFAVAVGTGISEKHIKLKQVFSMAFSFGFFQAIMPIIGFFLASFFSKEIIHYDHWIAFILLGYLGGNMIYAGWHDTEENITKKDIFSLRSLITLGIATSIDALAVGVSLTASIEDIYFPALLIGGVTFVVSCIGLEFGKKWGSHIGSKSEIIGGIILIAIGIKILSEHIFR